MIEPARKTITLVLLLFALCACNRAALLMSAPPPDQVTVTIIADGETHELTTSAATVTDALAEAQIHLGALDRVEPGEYLALEEAMVITVVRVIEQYQTVEVVVPFEQQFVRNEGLPEGERKLLQAGRTGLEEITYRIEYHDGVEVDRRMVRRNVLEAAAEEIVMIGSQGTVSPLPIPGTLAYISAGNGVAMRVSSTNRDFLTSSGDLDGRVFALSPDGRWLLYTRSTHVTSTVTGTLPAFNSLWVASYRPEPRPGPGALEPVKLEAENVLWAGWSPDGERIAYSTANPVAQPPGWEANNDLWLGKWDGRHRFQVDELLEPSSGGIYGWWGADYAWSPSGRYLAYGRADGVGFIDVVTAKRVPLAEFSVFHTYADWVWTPAPTWSPDSRFVAAAVHGPPPGPEAAEDSQVFDLWGWHILGWVSAPLAARTGMWASPVWSPARQVADEEASQIAFLRATRPLESATSRYTLWVMDRDGSDARLLFPPAGEMGLRPQTVTWSPEADQVALIYRGDLYLISTVTGSARPLTGDGINSNATWAPWGQALLDLEPEPTLEPERSSGEPL